MNRRPDNPPYPSPRAARLPAAPRLRHARPRHAAPGFTLVELVMVMVVVGLLAVVALPRFFDRSAFDERGFLDETLAAVRYARQLALASGCEVQVSIGAGGYALRRRSGCSSGAFATPVPHPVRSGGFSAAAPSGVSIAPAAVFYFDHVGRPHAAGGALLTAVTDIGIGGLTLRLEPETGYVHEP